MWHRHNGACLPPTTQEGLDEVTKEMYSRHPQAGDHITLIVQPGVIIDDPPRKEKIAAAVQGFHMCGAIESL